MTKDDIIRMAREAELPTIAETGEILGINSAIRFANLVAAAERDAICALLDSLVDTYQNRDRQGSAEDIRKLIQYIHARGQ